MATLVLIGFYLMYCVHGNIDYISNGNMPDTWYVFSYFVVLTFMINLWSIISYRKRPYDGYNAVSLLSWTVLLGFVGIETIVCSNYRTDGFSLNTFVH